jgi:hypothetical protein
MCFRSDRLSFGGGQAIPPSQRFRQGEDLHATAGPAPASLGFPPCGRVILARSAQRTCSCVQILPGQGTDGRIYVTTESTRS